MPISGLHVYELVEAIPDAVLLVRASGEIAYANAAVAHIFERVPASLIDQPLHGLLPLGAELSHVQQVARYFANPAPGRMTTRAVRGRRGDGSEFPAEIVLSMLSTDHGPVTMALIRDISERQDLVRELALSEEKYRQLVEGASEVFYRVEVERDAMRARVVFVSGQCQTITGQSAEVFLSDREAWFRAVHPDDQPGLVDDTARVLGTGENGVRSYRLWNQALGEYRWVEDRVSALRNSDDRVIGYQGVARDVTEERRHAAQRAALEQRLQEIEKLDALGRMAGGIAHDFSNHLTVMMSACEEAEAMLDGADGPRPLLQLVREAGARSSDLVRQLLAFSRRAPAELVAVDLNDDVARIAELVRHTVGRDIDLDLQMCAEPCAVLMDRSQLDQILMNLAVNARDAMASGGTLTFRTSTLHMAGTEWVELSATDTGVGMDEATRTRALEPLFTTKAPGQGTGLGLSTVHSIVARYGGRIEIASRPGHGTIVRVLLPRLPR